jgi:hypothetical protein
MSPDSMSDRPVCGEDLVDGKVQTRCLGCRLACAIPVHLTPHPWHRSGGKIQTALDLEDEDKTFGTSKETVMLLTMGENWVNVLEPLPPSVEVFAADGCEAHPCSSPASLTSLVV